ncbi:CHASE2 and HATPase_c domain-containing protein [uncultured Brevundimonas sp.]|uniref:CHASE2 and HATPase_c domain-containing protein n=1 Tax=uncultured Brevundimonas sp. TaxID=213418 RepID=UPI0026300DA8|nr:CHASE2 and HATPase_c domain-containing protein [uncultured Brevundimonas sp.]
MKPPTTAISRDFADKRLSRKVLAEWMLTSLVSIVLVVWLAVGQTAERGNDVFYDRVQQLNAGPAHPDIVVVGIDDRSLRELGAWPWPRARHAELIDQLALMNVQLIAYDMLFIEPTPDDQILADAISRAGNVYLPASVDQPGLDGEPSSVTLPPEPLAQSAAGIGHPVLTPDKDGTVRQLPLWVYAGRQELPHLGLIALSERPNAPTVRSEGVPASRIDTGIYPMGQRLIRFPSGHSPYTTVSFVDVLRGEVHPDFLRNKMVVVGATAQGMGDRYAIPSTPDGSLTPGVNIVAALMQDVLAGPPVHEMGPALRGAVSIIPLMILLVGFLLLTPSANTVLGLFLIFGSLITSALLLRAGIWWPPAAACIGVIFAWPLWSWRRLAAAYRYMRGELSDLRADAATHTLSALASDSDWRSGDQVSRQVMALSSALKQFRNFNRYITQSVSSLPDAALVADSSGQVLIANRRAEALFQNRPLVGASLDDLMVSLGARDWRKLIDAPEGQENEVLLPDQRTLEIAVAGLIDSNQQSAGLIVRIADVTRLHAAERERQMTLQLLGHDMRAPQVSILTLLSGSERPANADEQIRRNARQTLSLAEGYVQLSRAENQTLDFMVVNLADLVTEAADTLWPQSAAKGIELITPVDDTEYLIEADAALMRRVIINLIDNAIRHTPTGGLVACRLSIHQDQILLIICDQGEGIAEDIKARLFQPFAGGNVSGAGLGLAFVHKVIQRHGGSITITPPQGIEEPTSGTSFYITLPMVADEPEVD